MYELAIIIPAYKARFMRQMLDSLTMQSDQRFNVYIGDDCSNEDLKSIVDEYTDRLNITFVRFEKNLGSQNLVLQWQRTIALTVGERWIWLFSDDDELESNCVEYFYQTLDLNPSSQFFHFDLDIIDKDSNIIEHTAPYKRNINSFEYYCSKMEGKIRSYAIENIFRRELYERVCGFEYFDLAWGSDTATWIKMMDISPMVTIEGCRVRWRSSDSNITPNYTSETAQRKALAITEFINWTNKHYSKERVRIANINFFIKQMRTYSKYIEFKGIDRCVKLFAEAGKYPFMKVQTIRAKILIGKLIDRLK